MSQQRHREVNAKVEGRDPPEEVKETMAPFKSLMARLLKVPMSEVKEQKQIYDEKQGAISDLPKRIKKDARRLTGLPMGKPIKKIHHPNK